MFASLGDLTLKGLGGPLPSCEVHWEPAPSLPEPVGGPALRLPFVGRNREATLFEQMLGAAAQGQGALLIVEGEQGSGKSRLLEEFGARASTAGTVLLRSRAFDTEGAPPYWMWRSPLDQLAHIGDGRVANVLLGLLSSPQLSAVKEGRRASRTPTSNALAVFDALARLLLEVADTRPTVVLLDDLHWADQASLQFLVYLSRTMAPHGLVVVGTSCPNVGPARRMTSSPRRDGPRRRCASPCHRWKPTTWRVSLPPTPSTPTSAHDVWSTAPEATRSSSPSWFDSLTGVHRRRGIFPSPLGASSGGSPSRRAPTCGDGGTASGQCPGPARPLGRARRGHGREL